MKEESALRIQPLSAALGAEVSGLDLARPLGTAAVEAIRAAFFDNHLLCFRSDPLDTVDFVRLGRHFGEPKLQLLRDQRDGEAPEVNILESTYKSAEDKPDDLSLVRLSGWHTDDSYFATPAKATMLQGLDIPSGGGQTKFANMHRAYASLPEGERARLDGLCAVHGYDTPRAPGRAKTRTAVEEAETPDGVHPLVRTHDDTARPAIYFNPNRTDRVEGMARAESDALLDGLYRHMTEPEFQYHHEWRVGDILLWDNRSLIHAVNTDYPVGEVRRHQRILLEGGTPT